MENVLRYLESLIHADDVLIVATSGGPDSMCLLNLLCKFNVKIVVAHVNHKLRKESEEEALFVKDFAEKHNLIYEYMEIKEYNHDNLENEARQKRYEFFKSLAHKYNASYVFTAHHGDDLIETILMRLTRGSSLKGYSGFKKENVMEGYKLIRPLITVTKKDILEYMEEHKLKYYIDESNNSKAYTRNRYRLDVLPFLKKENKDVHLKFLKFSEELEKANNFIDQYIKNIILDIKGENGFLISKLKGLDNYVLEKTIEYILSLYYPNDLFLISDKHRDLVINLVKSDKSNLKVNLPNGIWAIKEYDILSFVYNIREDYVYLGEFSKEVVVQGGVIRKIEDSTEKSNYVLRLNSKDIELPILIRNRRDGDRMEVKNLKGSKKVKDILIDSKVVLRKRKNIPIVTDSKNRILWIPGVKKSKFDMEYNENYDIILSYEEEKNK